MGTWTREEQARYFYAMDLRERRKKHHRMVVTGATMVGMGLILALMVRLFT
jgi:hypothetical protein